MTVVRVYGEAADGFFFLEAWKFILVEDFLIIKMPDKDHIQTF